MSLVDKHSFRLSIANEYGIDIAVFLESIAYWIDYNRKNKKHFHDGFYWTRNTLEALTEIFPYWSTRQLERVIKNSLDEGLLLKRNHNKTAYDRTQWFTLTEKGLNLFGCAISPNGEMENTKWGNGNHQTVTPIPITNTVTNTVIKNSSASDDAMTEKNTELFDLFWQAYPKKTDKKAAYRAWVKNKLDDKANFIISDINQRKHNNWHNLEKQFIPNPASYLNGEKWNDEIYKTNGANNGRQSKSEKSFSILTELHRQAVEEERARASQSFTEDLDHDSLRQLPSSLA